MFAGGVGRRLQCMRRRLMLAIAAVVITGASCGSSEVGTGASSPPTGTTLVSGPADTGALPDRGHGREVSR